MTFSDLVNAKCPDIHMETNVPMKKYTTFRAGGNAAFLAVADSIRQLSDLVLCAKEAGMPYLLIGNGSNILFRDGIWNGLVIRLGSGFESIHIEDNGVLCGSAVLMSRAARAAADASLTGLEFMSGIPGTVGGGVYMNAGAYGGEISAVIGSALCLMPSGQTEMLPAERMALSYRHSLFMEQEMIVLSVLFRLRQGNKEQIEACMRELNDRRRDKQPLEYPSAGSFFKRPEGYFAGALIEQCGLKGFSVGDAAVSEKHAGFIINKGSATASDIIALMHAVQKCVFERFGVHLMPEVRIVGSEE